ncbi:TRAP transporter small permease [Sneathiella litorea]|uniref:TRAP transporter small permease protein n=1 Tax=Sneathiella litorea TaxID=2606216 RepID=A0A6L8W4P5_9PROT|nr:TRAP transporter small permease [Sneathiella litorea]MZR30076.1 TRAP transporter small permease subunit [Sneathiella litorea]
MKDNSSEEETFSSSVFIRFVEYLSFGAAVLSAVLVVFTLFMTGYSVFQRYVLGTPITWTDEMSGFLVVAIVMLGAAETLRRGEHISVDLLTSKATGRRKKALGIWSYLATAFLAAVIFISTWEAVKFSYTIGVYSSGYLEAPLWIPQSFLLVGSGLLFLISLVRAYDGLRSRKGD